MENEGFQLGINKLREICQGFECFGFYIVFLWFCLGFNCLFCVEMLGWKEDFFYYWKYQYNCEDFFKLWVVLNMVFNQGVIEFFSEVEK